LYYYSEKDIVLNQPKGSIKLEGAHINDEITGKSLDFDLTTVRGKIHWRADNEAQKQRWVEAMSHAIVGNVPARFNSITFKKDARQAETTYISPSVVQEELHRIVAKDASQTFRKVRRKLEENLGLDEGELYGVRSDVFTLLNAVTTEKEAASRPLRARAVAGGKTYWLGDLHPSDTVLSVKQKLAKMSQLSIDLQALYLTDDNRADGAHNLKSLELEDTESLLAVKSYASAPELQFELYDSRDGPPPSSPKKKTKPPTEPYPYEATDRAQRDTPLAQAQPKFSTPVRKMGEVNVMMNLKKSGSMQKMASPISVAHVQDAAFTKESLNQASSTTDIPTDISTDSSSAAAEVEAGGGSDAPVRDSFPMDSTSSSSTSSALKLGGVPCSMSGTLMEPPKPALSAADQAVADESARACAEAMSLMSKALKKDGWDKQSAHKSGVEIYLRQEGGFAFSMGCGVLPCPPHVAMHVMEDLEVKPKIAPNWRRSETLYTFDPAMLATDIASDWMPFKFSVVYSELKAPMVSGRDAVGAIAQYYNLHTGAMRQVCRSVSTPKSPLQKKVSGLKVCQLIQIHTFTDWCLSLSALGSHPLVRALEHHEFLP
jgi:hypothetical protein